MPEFLAPGVFIEDMERGPRPIEGVPTSTAAFLGETGRGPTRPRLVTSLAEYQRCFGGAAANGGYMPYAVAGFFENGGRRAYICRIAGDGARSAALAAGGLRIEAVGPGEWGNRLFVRLGPSTSLSGPERRPAGFRLQVAYWETAPAGGAPPDPFADPASVPRPTLVEDFDDLVWDDPGSPDFYGQRLQDQSVLVRVAPAGALTAAPSAGFAPLSGGADGAAPTVADYRGDGDAESGRSGLAALELDDYREVALVAAPAAPDDVVEAVCEHCERNRFRFAAIDAPAGRADGASLDPRSTRETAYAAYYYPWVYATDPQGARKLVPPSGHVLGLYARTDSERGVWKAPANEVLRGISGLEFEVSSAVQEILNPRGVNVIREFPGRGIRVWGARTLSANSLWKYISVRRLFIFLERSILEGTRWAVFEPNHELLWGRVRDTIRLFLRAQWRSGALMGETEEEAFSIACDRSTMTQTDIESGRLICEIGVAPVRPAEFVIFRIFQNTAEAQS
jgi:hypothetical protein